MQLQETHEANLLVTETEEDDVAVAFDGSDCIEHFIQWLDDQAEEGHTGTQFPRLRWLFCGGQIPKTESCY